MEIAMSCLKFLNVFVSVFVTLIAICLIGLVAAGYASLSDTRAGLLDVASVNYYATALFVAAILLVILLLFGGICGVAGSIQQVPNVYCLLFYAIISLICAFWFLGIAITAYKAPESYFSGNCTSVSIFEQINNYSASAVSAGICQSGCQCYFPAATNAAIYTTAQMATVVTEAPNTTSSDTTQAVRSQDCPAASNWNTTTTFSNADSIMTYLETFVKCTQWCIGTTAPLFYRFTNVSNGIPSGYCYDTLKAYVIDYSRTIYIIGFIMTGITLLAFLFGCCLRKSANELPEGVKNDGPSQMRLYG